MEGSLDRSGDRMIRTKRIAEPADDADGARVLIARYRPRGVRKGSETWHAWEKRLAPSAGLLDAFLGKRRVAGRLMAKGQKPIPWQQYVQRFLEEMRAPEAQAVLGEFATRSRRGETITLLCYCEDENRCHRSLVRDLIVSLRP